MLKALIFGLFIIVIFALSILLQIYLSKQNKWSGLVIPGICLLLSIVPILNTPAYYNSTKTVIEKNGEVISEVVTKDNANGDAAIGSLVLLFLVCNIPTAVYLAIYFACRGKEKNNSELEKMTIQDLE
ncbi:MAG: hypothetical protein GX206_06825 [Clostridiales bacterium]|nr:hypothetical protein [Clostridiales bacterium]